ncbi:hypothetical protein ACTFIU_003937 [Dictyostelium citrinum]
MNENLENLNGSSNNDSNNNSSINNLNGSSNNHSNNNKASNSKTYKIKKESESNSYANDEVDELLLCPVCSDMIKEPFISKCGHSFCYQCIIIHLSKSKTCPICMVYLTREQIFPNFALNKFVEKIGVKSSLLPTPTVKQFRNTLSNENLTLHDINLMVSTLLEKKKNMEVHDQQVEYDILLDFLQKTRSQKMETFKQLKRQISYLENDIKAIEHQKDISETLSNGDLNDLDMLRDALLIGKGGDDSNIVLSIPHHSNNNNSKSNNIPNNSNNNNNINNSNNNPNNNKNILESSLNGTNTATTIPATTASAGTITTSATTPTSTTASAGTTTTTTNNNNNNSLLSKKRRVEIHLDDLQSCYFSAYNESDYDSPTITSESNNSNNNKNKNNNNNNILKSPSSVNSSSSSIINTNSNINNLNNNIESLKVGKGLLSFSRNLLKFTKYNEFKVLATLKYGDLFNTSSIVSSIEFDRDEEYFATAGVTKKIKIFEFSQIRDNVEVHSPIKEMTCRSKISCLSWNTYIKSQIASSDYEGIISLWDANTGQNIMTLEEHEKRVWSVDFSRTDPTQLASGSDDTRVKLWSTTAERAITTIESKANICCVKFNPCSSNLIAFGSADHHIHYYDLRQYKDPLLIFKGHRKAVSYVKFMNKDEIISASTDSTLKLWNVNQNDCVRTFTGHSNEKNFVGLTVNGDYICCGSENNGVYTYYKTLSKPIVTHRFGANSGTGEETDDDGSQFVSSVCWKKDSNILLAANSQGNIKILSLV